MELRRCTAGIYVTPDLYRTMARLPHAYIIPVSDSPSESCPGQHPGLPRMHLAELEVEEEIEKAEYDEAA
jgi:hypothetical protein